MIVRGLISSGGQDSKGRFVYVAEQRPYKSESPDEIRGAADALAYLLIQSASTIFITQLHDNLAEYQNSTSDLKIGEMVKRWQTAAKKLHIDGKFINEGI